jgi:hypothetical protein
MRSTQNLKILAVALALTAAVSTLEAQALRQQQTNRNDLIALRAEVDGRAQPYTLKEPSTETIPLREGEQIRVHLVGTVVDKAGTGAGRPIDARFSIAAGRDQIDIVQTGPNWVVVRGKPRKNEGLGQILYEITGNYDMKSTWKTGRLTFRVEDAGSAGTSPVPITQRPRWDRAEDLTAQLYRSILGVAPQGDLAQRDIEHIYEMGAIGVRDVALELADDADDRYDRLAQDDAVEVLGDLYRGLLRRTGSDSQLWDQDSGFRANVDTLRRQGYEKIVQVILDAPEFRTANDLSQFGSLAGHSNDDDWRDRPSRYAIRQN